MAAGWVYVCLLVVSCLVQAWSQNVYSPTCDCAYWVDGKCAYTLLLPASSSETTCPSDSSESDNDEVWQAIETLDKNVTDLSDWLNENTRILSRTQDLSMQNDKDIGDLDKRIKDLESGSVGSGDMNSDTEDDELTERVETLETSVDELEDTVEVHGTDIEKLKADVEVLNVEVQDIAILEGQMKEITDRVVVLEEGQAALEADVASLKAAVCETKGILVDVPDSSVMLSASTVYDEENHSADKAKMSSEGAWCPSNSTDTEGEPNQDEEYIQTDFGKTETIYSILTKGRYDFEQYVLTYKMNYTLEDDTTWVTYTNPLNEIEIFTGNSDQNTLQQNDLWQYISTRYVRIIPLDAVRNKCMRVDYLGCVDEV